jgi:hypothetical protein
MIEVFKTNIAEQTHAMEMTMLLQHHFPGSKVNFDLDDCDNILRIEGDNIAPDRITTLLRFRGFVCETLE